VSDAQFIWSLGTTLKIAKVCEFITNKCPKLWAILVLAERLAPMEEDADFREPAIIDDEWIAEHGTIIDELFKDEAGIARLIDGVDELSA